MSLPAWRYDELENIVVDLLERIPLTHFPISGFELAQRLNIEVIPYSIYEEKTRTAMRACSKDAFNIRTSTGELPIIFYDDTKPYERINFSLLHEISHIILDHREHSPLAEAEANFATGYIVAPPVWINSIYPITSQELAQCCSISEEAARYRLIRYKKWHTYYVKHNYKLKNHEWRLQNIFLSLQKA